MESKKIYTSLDIAKYVMAIMILWGHTANEWAHITGIWHYILSFPFIVPTFFAISGFLFFSRITSLQSLKEKDNYYKKWSIRIGRMYLVWSLIYLIFNIASWIIQGAGWDAVLRWIHNSLVYSTYGTIWFLPALWIGGSVVYVLYTRCSKYAMGCIVGILWILGLMFGPYSDIFVSDSIFKAIHDWYISVFITFRHGLFFATVYVFVGYLAVIYHKRFSMSRSAFLVVVSFLFFTAEAFVMKKITVHSDTDMAAFMVPLSFFILLVLLSIQLEPKKMYVDLRNQSMLIFCGQRLFLSAIPSVIPYCYVERLKGEPSITITAVFTVIVLLFGWGLNRLIDRYGLLKFLR